MKALKTLKILRLGQVFILLTIFSGWIFAQISGTAPTPKPKPRPAPKTECPGCPVSAPKVETPPPRNSRIVGVDEVAPPSTGVNGRRVQNENDTPFEKSIDVDEKVNFNLCVSEGNIRINGWDRNEIRVFVRGGSKAGFIPRGKNDEGNPTSLKILGYDPKKDKGRNLSDCLFGEEIELDVPKEANLSKLEGWEDRVTIKVESINKVTININEGDIQLEGIQEGVSASTNDGDITVENSFGPIQLKSTNGNILAYNTDPLEDSDTFKVGTNNGMIILQSVTHLSVEAKSISGVIKYTGEIQMDGDYKFTNTSGEINLAVPRDSSFNFVIIAEKNKIQSELPIKIINDNVSPSVRTLRGTLGEGEASLYIQNDSGRIRIRKLN
ncbi:MAG: DUF4097 domain-containing protein [Pyrinomonadaceae bacterium]|nr:DUF4097 domain-containing protein [Pyrinomonadaceae bacterium]